MRLILPVKNDQRILGFEALHRYLKKANLEIARDVGSYPHFTSKKMLRTVLTPNAHAASIEFL